jgi:serpin B
MKLSRVGAIAACAAATCIALGGAASGTAAASNTPGASTAASAESGFALSLLHYLGTSGNVVYSPYSIDTALSMADAGATGQTSAQISKVLGAGASETTAVADARAVTDALHADVGSGTDAPTLEIANGLWTQTGLSLKAPFVDTLTSDFGAPPQSTDFSSAPEAARTAINAWVAAHTQKLINNLLPKGSISPATAFVLANAIYLKAHWASPFNRALTHSGPFTTASGATASVKYMTQKQTTYSYAAGSNYQAVALPYLSSQLSLLAILPRSESLSSFDTSLTEPALTKIVNGLRPRSVNLELPKLDLNTQTSLNAVLQKLGIRDAFKASANFSALTSQRALNISLVEHAAVLKIDEQGTVAAGATAIVGPTAVEVPPKAVSVAFSHPYLLVLRDQNTGAILFVAAVANPSQS